MATKKRSRQQPFNGKWAVICGGSKGIGKETAHEILRLGGSVTLLARHEQPLASAALEMQKARQSDTQFIEFAACDTTDAQRTKSVLEAAIGRHGVPDYLINCVGYARPRYVQELTLEDFRAHMEVNYFGQLVPIHVLLPYFLKEGKGHIANCASMMGYFGIMGYAAYAPTKFALVGLSEALRHELKPYSIAVSVLYPPDTDTPGLAQEQQVRPAETEILAGSVDLLSAQEAAAALVDGLLKKQYMILPGEAGWVWRLNRFAPWLVRRLLDRKYVQAMKETGRSE